MEDCVFLWPSKFKSPPWGNPEPSFLWVILRVFSTFISPWDLGSKFQGDEANPRTWMLSFMKSGSHGRSWLQPQNPNDKERDMKKQTRAEQCVFSPDFFRVSSTGSFLYEGFYQGPSMVEPCSHKPPTSFPYFKGFFWEWFGSSVAGGFFVFYTFDLLPQPKMTWICYCCLCFF